MTRTAALSLVAGVFIAGIAVGAIGREVLLRGRHGPPGFAFGPGRDHGRGPGRGPGPDGGLGWRGGPSFADRLRQELDLTAEQASRIAAILEETSEESRALRETLRPQVQALMDRSAQRIDEALSAEQREAFARLRRERGADRFFLDRGPRPAWGDRGRDPEAPPPSPRDSPL